MNAKRLLLLIFTLFLSYGSWSQIKVTGKVVDDIFLDPIKDVNVKVKETGRGTTTNANGVFELTFSSNEKYTLEFTHVSFIKKSLVINPKDIEGNVIDVRLMGRNIIIDPINVSEKRKGSGFRRMPGIPPSLLPNPTMDFSGIVKSFIGVSSSNELTANYNVRGGNFDENLVYVNDVAIYKPQLARAGQQEGLSFIHSELVDNVQFSAGGFQARYGDKLSSVLDVTYREPTEKFAASVIPSFMGVQSHIEGRPAKRISYLAGFRLRANSYILGGLETEGEYKPLFMDFQTVTNFHVTENFKVSVLTHYANNKYRVVPQNRETNFGTINQALSLRVYFEGQEVTQFETFTGAVSFDFVKKDSENEDKLRTKLILSSFISDESETFDVLGEYFINELETDLGSEELGDSSANIGIGAFLDHARNELNVRTGNFSYLSTYNLDLENENSSGQLYWGARYRYQFVNDYLREWHMVDSAGYSVPQGDPNKVELYEVIRADNQMESHKATAYFQNHMDFRYPGVKTVHYKIKDSLGNKIKKDTTIESSSYFSYDLGVRGGYWSYNDEFWLTPRASINFRPKTYFYREIDSSIIRRPVNFRLSTGLYYQPPFFRSIRDLYGNLHPEVKAQKSLHVVLGADAYFNLFKRPFKFIAEAYYKYLWDVNPYEVDNVRVRYYANNDAKAYAYGLDFGVNGQLIPGIESWLKLGFLQTREDLLHDDYYLYLNSSGDTIIPGYTADNEPVDSLLQSPGYIPRPSDKLFNISLLFQDNMPGFEALSVQLNLQYGTGLPYGPPDYKRYKDTLRTKSYFRVDIGFSMDFLYWRKNKEVHEYKMPWLKDFQLSFEVFNLLNINNTVNYLWLQDISGRYYSIPNNLTGRRFNLKLIARFGSVDKQKQPEINKDI